MDIPIRNGLTAIPTGRFPIATIEKVGSAMALPPYADPLSN